MGNCLMSTDKRNLMSTNGFSRPDQDGFRKGFSYSLNSDSFLDSSTSQSTRSDFQASPSSAAATAAVTSKSHLNNSISSGQAYAKSSSNNESRTVPHSSSTSHLQIVIALYNYNAKDDGDLSFRKGDRLIILDNGDPDWWLAKHKSTNQKGYIPRNFVVSQAIETEE